MNADHESDKVLSAQKVQSMWLRFSLVGNDELIKEKIKLKEHFLFI